MSSSAPEVLPKWIKQNELGRLDNKLTGTGWQDDRMTDGKDHVLSQADALTKIWYHSSFRPKGARALHRSRNISITFLQSLFCYRGLVSQNNALLVWLSVTYCTAQWWVTSACSPCSLGALTFTPNTVVLLHYSQFHILFGCFPSSTPTSTTTLTWAEMVIFSFDPATHPPVR